MKELLWSKFWTGTAPLLVLALVISVLTNYFLGVGEFMFYLSTFTITLMTLAISGLALCFGTMFPQFDTENAAQIPTSFGGLLFMMTSIVLIGVIIILEARPVYEFLHAQSTGTGSPDYNGMFLTFSAVALLCLLATLIPLRLALRKMESIER
jgi:ABC-2 type transport system permease protein